MKKTFFIRLFLLVIALVITNNFDSYSRQKDEYLISGKIKGLPDNVKLSFIKENGDTVQETQSKDGQFQFKLQDLTKDEIYFVILDETTFKLPKPNLNWLLVVVDSPSIKISGEADQWPNLDITGSEATKVYEHYQQGNKVHYAKAVAFISSLSEEERPKASGDFSLYINSDTGSLTREFKNGAYKNWKDFVRGYIKTNINSVITPSLIMKSIVLSLDDKKNAYNSLTELVKNSPYGKQLSDYLKNESNRALVDIGKEMPDFNINTPEGKSISINKLIGENKLTLIDFWASWCSPCRAAIPHLKEVYKEFSGKGFNIIGIVTAKSDKDATWKKALATDQTPWNHGMDITNASDLLFPKIGIPGYVLVDGAGKIIATELVDGGKGLGKKGPGITGEDLAKTIRDLLDK